jgi:hypothetical protein
MHRFDVVTEAAEVTGVVEQNYCDATARSREHDMIKLRAELKCYLCGRTAGVLEGMAGSPRRFETFRPAPGMESLLGLTLGEARCPLCTGGLFIDEVERVYSLSERRLKPEKRGRKPRRRPEAVAS